MAERPFNCGFYVMENVREIENLIPKKIVAKLCPGKELTIFDKDPSFFDMKLGLKYENLYDNMVCRYWENLLAQPQIFKEIDDIKTKCKDEYEYKSKVGNKSPILPSYGSDLLKLALNKSEKQKRRLNSKDNLYSISKTDLNTSQQREWEAIGKEMFSWTCCLKGIQ